MKDYSLKHMMIDKDLFKRGNPGHRMCSSESRAQSVKRRILLDLDETTWTTTEGSPEFSSEVRVDLEDFFLPVSRPSSSASPMLPTVSMTVGATFGAEGSAFLSLSPPPGAPRNSPGVGSSRRDPGIGTLGFGLSFILKRNKQL